jgi:hypothetical protein
MNSTPHIEPDGNEVFSGPPAKSIPSGPIQLR